MFVAYARGVLTVDVDVEAAVLPDRSLAPRHIPVRSASGGIALGVNDFGHVVGRADSDVRIPSRTFCGATDG